MQKKLFPLLLSCLLTFQVSLFSSDYFCEEKNECQNASCDEEPWFIRLEIAGVWGQFIKFNKNYKEIGLFAASPLDENVLSFVDLRGYRLEKGHYAANTGIGIRWLSPWSQVLGANFYYDYRKVPHGHFNQIGIGFESLSPCFDIRINGYLPLNDTVCSSKRSFSYPGGHSASCRKKEFAYKGVTGEIGLTLWMKCQLSVYGAFGPYYYTHKQCKSIIGGYTRIELHIFDYLTLEGNLSYDKRFKEQAQGRIVLSIPLDALRFCSKNDQCFRFLSQPVKRNPLIAFFHKCCDWKWSW